jgi:drug/metabolite transporter (DMT)-like permease
VEALQMTLAALTFTTAVNFTPLYILAGIFVVLALCCLLPGER